MRHINITATPTIDNILVLKESNNFRNIVKTSSKKISVKASAANPLVNPPPGDKTLGLDPVASYHGICYIKLLTLVLRAIRSTLAKVNGTE